METTSEKIAKINAWAKQRIDDRVAIGLTPMPCDLNCIESDRLRQISQVIQLDYEQTFKVGHIACALCLVRIDLGDYRYMAYVSGEPDKKLYVCRKCLMQLNPQLFEKVEREEKDFWIEYEKENSPQSQPAQETGCNYDSERVIGIRQIRDNLDAVLGDFQANQTPIPSNCNWLKVINIAVQSLNNYIELVKEKERENIPF